MAAADHEPRSDGEGDSQGGAPDRWSLTLSGANPSPGGVDITLAVPNAASVRVSVYDVRGRRVRTLQQGMLDPGYRKLRWDRSLEDGGRAAAGVYFLRAEASGFRQTRKVVLLPAGR